MAITWQADVFDQIKGYAEGYKSGLDQREALKTVLLTAATDILNTEELQKFTTSMNNTIGQAQGVMDRYKGLLNTLLTNELRNVIASSATNAAGVAADIVTFMTRDSQTVKVAGQSAATTYYRDGDGTLSGFDNNTISKVFDDVYTLQCTTAQGAGDAVFSVFSRKWGLQSGTVTADGVANTNFSDIGVDSITITAGTAGNEWELGDIIQREINVSYTAGIYGFLFADAYNVLLPTSATPTITAL